MSGDAGPQASAVHRFLFDDLDIRGALVQLGPAWQAMHAGRGYAAPVRALLGELAAVSTVIAGNLKTPGRLTFQLQGHGPVSMLVMDCDEQLHLRGMARSTLTPGALAQPATLPLLLGDGQLTLTLQHAKGAPYQSIVPMTGDSLSAAFSYFLEQSEQQPAQLRLDADAECACALFLQKLPGADQRDPDGWNRVTQLAGTVRPDELRLAPATLLSRLFAEETVRLFPAREVIYHCPRDEEKVKNMLLSLGRDELAAMLADASEIVIEDEICGHEYRFDAAIMDELFPPDGRTLH